MNDITMLQCSRCKETKSSDNFGKHPTRGFQFYCKACQSEYARTHVKGNGQTKKDLTDVAERRCSGCHKMKPAKDFNKHSMRGIQFNCKECIAWYNRRGVHNGLLPEEYQTMLSRQENSCACCGQAETRKRGGIVQALSTDHNHATGKLRALVCHACNTAIGAVEKYGKLRAQPERTRAIIAYLNTFNN